MCSLNSCLQAHILSGKGLHRLAVSMIWPLILQLAADRYARHCRHISIAFHPGVRDNKGTIFAWSSSTCCCQPLTLTTINGGAFKDKMDQNVAREA